jgi:hypothetical protein
MAEEAAAVTIGGPQQGCAIVSFGSSGQTIMCDRV